MRVRLDGQPGDVAANIQKLTKSLMAAAIADGGDLDQICEEIAKAAGATKIGVKVGGKPRWKFLVELQEQSAQVYRDAMKLAQRDIRHLLESATEDADVERYRERVK